MDLLQSSLHLHDIIYRCLDNRLAVQPCTAMQFSMVCLTFVINLHISQTRHACQSVEYFDLFRKTLKLDPWKLTLLLKKLEMQVLNRVALSNAAVINVQCLKVYFKFSGIILIFYIFYVQIIQSLIVTANPI